MGSRSLAGRLLHRRGPATAIDRSPRRLRVCWMTHVRASDDRSRRLPAAVTGYGSVSVLPEASPSSLRELT